MDNHSGKPHCRRFWFTTWLPVICGMPLAHFGSAAVAASPVGPLVCRRWGCGSADPSMFGRPVRKGCLAAVSPRRRWMRTSR
jgi:hypothetical protein